MVKYRAEFEINTCSSRTQNNLLQHGHEIRVDTRLLLRVFRVLRHQSPSLRGVAKRQSGGIEKFLLVYLLFPLYIDTKTVKIL